MSGTDEQKMLHLLAHSLLTHAEAIGGLEGNDDGGWIHGASCGGGCDYACGAIWLSFTRDDDGCPTFSLLENSGTLRVELPGGEL